MSAPDLPTEIRDFILRHIHSVASLELLVFLHATRPQFYSIEQISRELRSNDSYVDSLVKELTANRVVEEQHQNGQTVYGLSRPQIDLIEKLSSIYQQRRTTVIDFIYRGSLERIKTFADAFKLRK